MVEEALMGVPGSTTRGFSLIEVVIVAVILGVIGAIAIPRVSRGASAAGENALSADLAAIRRAIEHYSSEHLGAFPTDASTIAAQLTQYTDAQGNTSPTGTATHRFGPYLCEIPALPVGPNKGSRAVRDGGTPGAGAEGWFYWPATGDFCANLHDTEVDSRGVRYNSY